MAYSRFDDATRAEAHAEYLASIDAYRHGDGYRIPGEFQLAAFVPSCRRPACVSVSRFARRLFWDAFPRAVDPPGLLQPVAARETASPAGR
jgi:hypothetical protein